MPHGSWKPMIKEVNAIRWPVKLLYVLDRYLQADQERQEQEQFGSLCSGQVRDEVEQSIEEIANVASSLVFGQYSLSVTGVYIELQFPPVRFHRRYATTLVNWRGDADRHLAAMWIADAYRELMSSTNKKG